MLTEAQRISSSDLHLVQHCGRWISSNDSKHITASWAGSSVTFTAVIENYARASRPDTFSLVVKFGPDTQLRESGVLYNVGLTVQAQDISLKRRYGYLITEAGELDLTVDIHSFLIKNEKEGLASSNYQSKIELTLTLLDWSSSIQLEGIVLTGNIHIIPVLSPSVRYAMPLILYIGDSVSCGFADSQKDIPFSCLSAFPFLTHDTLKIERPDLKGLEIEVIAYPGITLSKSSESSTDLAMIEKFFHSSPFDTHVFDFDSQQAPKIIIITLGTNDDAQDIPVTTFIRDIQLLITRLLDIYQSAVQHICISPPFPDFIDSTSHIYTSAIQDLIRNNPFAARVDLHFLEIASGLRKELTLDGLHPSMSGHEIVAEALTKRLVPLLEP